ncbi:MAG: short-chain dehydrogenase [Nocardioidaceae bacterium]|nr:short-chain dehydrogenase [Nocardioidaceae bacterium]
MTQRALVTGATAGIGHAFARALASRGYDLVLVSRDLARLQAVADQISTKHGVEVTVVSADLSSHVGLAKAVAAVDGIDLLINNAGSSIAGWFGKTDIAAEESQLDLMVRAPMVLTDAALKQMVSRGSGKIINVASMAAFTPRGIYAAHKAWLVNLGLWLNLQYADSGVTVTTLCPGFVHIEFHQRMNAKTDDIPRWMWLDADKVVAAALRDLERGKALSIPTARYKALAVLARTLPIGLVSRVAKKGR